MCILFIVNLETNLPVEVVMIEHRLGLLGCGCRSLSDIALFKAQSKRGNIGESQTEDWVINVVHKNIVKTRTFIIHAFIMSHWPCTSQADIIM